MRRWDCAIAPQQESTVHLAELIAVASRSFGGVERTLSVVLGLPLRRPCATKFLRALNMSSLHSTQSCVVLDGVNVSSNFHTVSRKHKVEHTSVVGPAVREAFNQNGATVSQDNDRLESAQSMLWDVPAEVRSTLLEVAPEVASLYEDSVERAQAALLDEPVASRLKRSENLLTGAKYQFRWRVDGSTAWVALCQLGRGVGEDLARFVAELSRYSESTYREPASRARGSLEAQEARRRLLRKRLITQSSVNGKVE